MLEKGYLLLVLCVSGALSFHYNLSPNTLSKKENNLLQHRCGHFKGPSHVHKSLYGAPSDIEAVPWVASLAYSRMWYPNMSETIREQVQFATCSGSLISPRHVITAAHCFGSILGDCENGRIKKIARVNLERFRVYLGGSCSDPNLCRKLRRDDLLTGRKVVRVYIPSNHTGTGCNEYRGDIALLELDRDVSFSAQINPVCLPQRHRLGKSKDFTTSGFGIDAGQDGDYMAHSGVLKTVLERQQKCETKRVNGEYRPRQFMGIDAFCTRSPYTSVCSGDSGGGMIQKLPLVKAQPFLAGVVRAGLPCLTQHKYHNKQFFNVAQSIATDIIWHLGWICRVSGVCPDAKMNFVDIKNHTGEVIELRPLSREELYAS